LHCKVGEGAKKEEAKVVQIFNRAI
jgi:hypothetical protein